jgi:hypothetical protein
MKIGNFQNVISLLKALFKNIVILFFALLFIRYSPPLFDKFNNYFYGHSAWLALGWLDIMESIHIQIIFFVSLFFTAFGDRYKYWWISVLLIPLFILGFYYDFEHVYFYIIFGLVGWLIGYGLNWLLQKRAGKQN